MLVLLLLLARVHNVLVVRLVCVFLCLWCNDSRFAIFLYHRSYNNYFNKVIVFVVVVAVVVLILILILELMLAYLSSSSCSLYYYYKDIVSLVDVGYIMIQETQCWCCCLVLVCHCVLCYDR